MRYTVKVSLTYEFDFDTADVPEDFAPQDGEEALWQFDDPASVTDYLREQIDDGNNNPADESTAEITDLTVKPRK